MNTTTTPHNSIVVVVVVVSIHGVHTLWPNGYTNTNTAPPSSSPSASCAAIRAVTSTTTTASRPGCRGGCCFVLALPALVPRLISLTGNAREARAKDAAAAVLGHGAELFGDEDCVLAAAAAADADVGFVGAHFFWSWVFGFLVFGLWFLVGDVYPVKLTKRVVEKMCEIVADTRQVVRWMMVM